MRGTDRPTITLFWALILIIAGIRILAGESVVPACLLAIVLLTSGIEIPVARKRMQKPGYTIESVNILEEIYSVELERDFSDKKRFFNTTITLNLGGFLIPLAAALYLGITHPNLASIEICVITIAVIYIMTPFRDGIGLVLPGYSGVVPLALSILLAPPGDVAAATFTAGVCGILIGLCAALSSIDTEQQGSPRISLGGAGSFQAIYMTMVLAALVSSIG
ncbi:MAG: DUF1614 domain-containing protein [Euryarchaeota archaeon]|nr:DUF1614 domain-containing protein [Euryarchaeota archaeon]